MIVTDTNDVADDASPDTINTSLHTHNSATNPDSDAINAENKMSVRQLLDSK